MTEQKKRRFQLIQKDNGTFDVILEGINVAQLVRQVSIEAGIQGARVTLELTEQSVDVDLLKAVINTPASYSA